MQVAAVLSVKMAHLAEADAIISEIQAIVASIPFPIWPGKAKHERHVGSVLLLNAMFELQLKAYGWGTDKPLPITRRRPDGHKSFGPVKVALEVQLGNKSTADGDLDKFKKIHRAGEAAMCCSIFMDKRTADLCADGVANFEYAKQLFAAEDYIVPTYVIGMSQEATIYVDVSDMGVAPEEIERNRNRHLTAKMAADILAGGGRRVTPAQGRLF